MVRTKGRRRITVNQKEYIWYVKPGYDNPYLLLHISSMDKSLVLIVPLDMDNPYFLCKTEQRLVRYLPPFAIPEIVTPETVSRLILWAESGENRTLYTGSIRDL